MVTRRRAARVLPLLLAALALLAVLFLQPASPAQAQSTDATLSALTVEASEDGDTTNFPKSVPIGAFAATTETYTATVDSRVGHVRLTPTVNDSGATVQVGKTGSLQTVASGSASQAIALNVGANPITVEVTAADGSTKKTYTVTITRQPPTVQFADRGFYTVNEVAAGNTGTEATVTVSITPPLAQASSVKVTTLAKSTATATDDYVVGGLNPSGALDLPAGATSASFTLRAVADNLDDARRLENVFLQLEAVASAPYAVAAHSDPMHADGTPSRARITIYDNSRSPAQQSQQSTDATLSGLTATRSISASGFFASLALSPAFASATEAYTATGSGEIVRYVKLTPTVNHSGATVQVGRAGSLQTVASGAASQAIAITALQTPIQVVVTAEDGSSTKTYTVTVTVTRTVAFASNRSNLNEVAAAGVSNSAAVTVNILPPLTQASSVTVSAVAPANADAPADYTVTGLTSVTTTGGRISGTLALPANAPSASFTVTAVADMTTEGSEIVTFQLAAIASPPYAVGFVSENRVRISDNSLSPADTRTVSLSVSSGTVEEGSSVTVKATLSAAFASEAVIPLTYMDINTETGDYSAPSSLTIAAGETEGEGTITANEDADFDDEDFTVAFGALPAAVTAGSTVSAPMAIKDNDLPAPTGLTVSAAGNKLDLSWTAPSGTTRVDGYEVQYKKTATTGDTVTGDAGTGWVKESGVTGTTHAITGLEASTAYSVRVRSLDSNYASHASAWVTGSGTPPLAVPENVSVTPGAAQGGPALRVTWDEEPAGHTFVLQVKTAAASWPARASTDSLPSGATVVSPLGTTRTFEVRGLSAGAAYDVRAHFLASGVGLVAASTTPVQATTWSVPGAPTAVTLSASSAQLDVAWTAPTNVGGTGASITGYKVRWRVKDTNATTSGDQPGAWNANDGVDADSTSGHAITGLTNGTAYEVQVRAQNGINPGSAWSAAQSGTPAAGTSQDPQSTSVWSATLTVRDISGSLIGCHNKTQYSSRQNDFWPRSDAGIRCDDTNNLSDHTFTHETVDYTITALNNSVAAAYGGIYLDFASGTDVSSALDGLNLCIGAKALPIASASKFKHNTAVLGWHTANERWRIGDPVAVSIGTSCSGSSGAGASAGELGSIQQTPPTPPTPGQLEPYNVQVTPGDGTLTVTWEVSPRDGFEDDEIKHALRWSQVSGEWGNPEDPEAGGREDGVVVQGGVYSYTITGLTNGVATSVFVRSFTGGSYSEHSPHSSPWVRTKGEHTTPEGPVPQQQTPPEEQAQSTAPAKPVIAGVVSAHGGVYIYLCETASCGPPDPTIVSWRTQYRLTGTTAWTDGPRLDGEAAPSRNFYIGGLDDAKTYHFRVRAVNAAPRSSPWSDQAFHRVVHGDPQQPNPPVHVRVTPGPSSFRLSWDPPAHRGSADPIAGYDYRYRKTTEQQWTSNATVRTSAAITGLSGSTAYQLQVRVYYYDSNGNKQDGRWTHALVSTTLAASQTFTIPATATGTEGGSAPSMAIILGQPAPAGGVSLSLTATYTGQTATSADVVSIPSSITILEGQSETHTIIPLVDDGIDEDDESFTISVTTSTTGWSRHSASPAQTVVTIIDDDTAGITVSPTMLDIQEGSTGTYTVELGSQPTASVTVTPLTADAGAATVAPASGTFTTTNWQTPQVFTVTGVQDGDFADETVSIGNQIGGNDAQYTALGADSVTVRVSDDDVAPTPTAPDAPAGLSLVPGMAEIEVTWSAPANNGGSTLTGYDLEYKTSTAASWSDAGHTGLTTSATITGLENAVQYDVRVRATNSIGDSAWTAVAQATPSLALVEFARSRQSALEGTSNVVVVSITPPLEQASSVTVTTIRRAQYKAIVNQDYTISGLHQGETLTLPAGAAEASFTVHTVADSVTEGEVEDLAFELSAVPNAPYTLGGQDGMLVIILDTSVAATTAPGVPSGFGLATGIDDITPSWDMAESAGPPSRRSPVPTVVSFYRDGSGNGIVTWSPPLPSQTVTGYHVHFKESEASDWEDVSPVFADVTTDIHYTRLDDGVSYDVRVRAVISGVPGPWSDTFTKTFGPTRADEMVHEVAGYELEYKEADLVSMPNYPVTGDPSTGTVRIYLDAEDASPHVIGGLDTFVGYKVRVRAWNVFGYGPWTPWEDATPTDPVAGMQWTSGLYIGNLSNGGTGCDNSETYKCNAVSTAPHPDHDNAEVVVPGSGALHTNEFNYGDTTYTVEELSLRNGVLRLRLDKDVPEALQRGGYLETRVTRPFQAMHWFKAGVAFAADVNADPKVLEWRGVKGNWPQPHGPNPRTNVILYGPGAERQQQVAISAPAQAFEGTEVKVRVILQPQDTTTRVSLSLRGSARYGEDYWLNGAGVDVLSDELAIAHVSFPAALAGQEARSQEVTLVINGDLPAEKAETISMVAEVVLDPTNPNLPDVVTPEWLEHRTDAASLTIPANAGQPTGLTMDAIDANGAAALTWVRPSGDGPSATGYQVQYRETGSDTWLDAGSAPLADDIWSATLNVENIGGSDRLRGCQTSSSNSAAQQCGQISTLSDSTFTLNGADHTVSEVTWSQRLGRLGFTVWTGSAVNIVRSMALEGYLLYADGEAFDFRDAASVVPSWQVPGLEWAHGDAVQLRLSPLDSHEITGLSADKGYDVRVRANSAEGPGPWTLADRPPAAPSRLELQSLNFPNVPGAQLRGRQLSVRFWEPRDTGYPSDAITGYEVQWRPDDSTIWRTSNATPSDVFTSAFRGSRIQHDGMQVWISVQNDGVHHVRVRAVNAVGPGPWLTADTAPPEETLPQAPANAIWSATLTVRQVTGSRGCIAISPIETDKCSTAATLTDNTFTTGGVNYRVSDITYSTSSKRLQFHFVAEGSTTIVQTSDWHGYLLYVDGVEFAFRESTYQIPNFDVDLTWDTGQKVRLWLVPRPPDPPNRIVLRPGHDEFMANWWPPSGPRTDAKGNVLPGGDADSGGAGIHQYQVRYTLGSNLGSDGWKIRTANPGDHHARVTTLEPGTRYRVQVRAVSDSGIPGPWSHTHLVDTYAEQYFYLHADRTTITEGGASATVTVSIPFVWTENGGTHVSISPCSGVREPVADCDADFTVNGFEGYFAQGGPSQKTFTVSAVDDGEAEPEEYFVIEVSGQHIDASDSDNNVGGWSEALFFTIEASAAGGQGSQSSPGSGGGSQGQEGEQGALPNPGQLEPYNVQVTPGDGTLTVTWSVAPRDGFENDQIRHALRWSQVSGVWANPPDPSGGGREDGLSVEGGVTSYVITGLDNDVATGVFVRSFTGGSYSERSEHSSKWVRTKGVHTTPTAGQQQQAAPRTFSVTPTASAVEGASATLTVTLSEAAPADGVTVAVIAGFAGHTAQAEDVGSIVTEAVVSAGSASVDISIPLVDDSIDEDDETFTVTLAVPEGWEVSGSGADTATVTIRDDDTAGVTVTPTTLSVAEDGSASYSVVLDTRPTDDVFVLPLSSDDGATYDALPLVFSPENWYTPRSITVSGADDADTSDESLGITHEASSGDPKYHRIPVSSVSVTVTDDDVQQQQQVTPKTYALSGAASAAEGQDAALTLTLSEAAPAGGVEFTVTAGYDGSADSGDVGSIASPVTVPEGSDTLTVVIPTGDDAVDEDDETLTVTIAAVTPGWDPAGAGQDAATVTIVDDDTAGVTITPTSLSIAEDGSVTYTVVLDSRPTADVTITAASADGGAASVSPASVTFTPSGWNVPLTFTVSGVADDDRDDESVGVSHLASSNDARYEGIAVASVAVAVADTTPPPAPESTCPEEAEPPEPGQREPYNICVTPGDGTLTVTWTVASRDGFEDGQIKHSLRWSQEPGVWANPLDPNAGGREDGIAVEGGVYTYTITGLQNGVATGVFIRSFTGGSYSERSEHSSKWVRTKGDHTTPRAE